MNTDLFPAEPETMTQVTITTDGGCEPNPGNGAWAAILRYGTCSRSISGAVACTTNNRMEITAIIEALRCLTRPCAVTLRVDSRYCINAIEANSTAKGRARWQRPKTPNKDLVAELWRVMAPHKIACEWVKGHAGDIDNEACDALAADAMRAALRPLASAG